MNRTINIESNIHFHISVCQHRLCNAVLHYLQLLCFTSFLALVQVLFVKHFVRRYSSYGMMVCYLFVFCNFQATVDEWASGWRKAASESNEAGVFQSSQRKCELHKRFNIYRLLASPSLRALANAVCYRFFINFSVPRSWTDVTETISQGRPPM